MYALWIRLEDAMHDMHKSKNSKKEAIRTLDSWQTLLASLPELKAIRLGQEWKQEGYDVIANTILSIKVWPCTISSIVGRLDKIEE